MKTVSDKIESFAVIGVKPGALDIDGAKEKALSEPVLDEFWLGYFEQEYQANIFEVLQETFESLGMTKTALAKKLGKSPEQITRWLSSPNNLESDTISNLALAMGYLPRLSLEKAKL
jgi:DNA-binding phage protein